MVKYWVLFEFYFTTKSVIHYYTLTKGILIDNKKVKFFKKCINILGFQVLWKQTIQKYDTFKFGVSVINLSCQLDIGQQNPQSVLTGQ